MTHQIAVDTGDIEGEVGGGRGGGGKSLGSNSQGPEIFQGNFFSPADHNLLMRLQEKKMKYRLTDGAVVVM